MSQVRTLIYMFLFVFLTNTFAQTIPVTLHYKPIIDNFTTLRLVGNFNGWNNSDPTMVMTDDDGDGVYEITKEFAPDVEHMYKFVMDADWGLAWNDPDNPLIKLTDNNNSILFASDPMITYLLPRDINSANEIYVDTSASGEPIRAIFAFTEANPIDPNSITLTIDGEAVDNPSQYYDAEKKELFYQPPVPLETGEHTVEVTVSSGAGTAERTATFERNASLVIYEVPLDFYYDEYNTGASIIQNINSVSLVGNFNNWNDQFDPMQDDDGDKLWEVTTLLSEGNYEYKIKLNGSLWLNDPDEPNFSENNDNNTFSVVADSIPRLKLVGPNEGTVYTSDGETFTFEALLRPGVKSQGVDESSIQILVDGTPATASFDSETSIASAEVTLTGEGNHTVEIEYSNNDGLSVSGTFVYGVFTGATGYYVADAIDDEPYTYPDGVADGSADILSVLIDEVPTHDSLSFDVDIEDITDRTRIGLLITNSVSTRAEDPLSLDIRTEDWHGEGIFVPIGAPGNTHENTDVENRFWERRDPVQLSERTVTVNDDAITTNSFNFNISLAYVDSLLGGWTRERNFYVFSYLANDDMSGDGFEVTSAEGASDDEEDPDVYDAAFFRSGFWQSRVLANYIPAGGRMGPRYVALNGTGRGRVSLSAEDVSDSLATYGPVVTFLTPAVTYWFPDVTVYGTIDDLTIPTVSFFFNDEESTVNVENGMFEVPLTLNEGENEVYVRAVDNQNFESTSKTLLLTYEKDHTPSVTIDGSVEGRSVSLTAEGLSPDGLDLTYFWSSDSKNPAFISVVSTDPSINFNIPNVDGEYFVNVRVRDSENRISNAKKMIIADGDSVYLSYNNHHAAWIDRAIFYEIYPRSFSNEGTFKAIEDRIPDMLDLGINAIWFMPIYTGPTIHGYEITDYFGFEADFGTEQDFRDLIDALHDAGIKVILDFVVNHTSIQHPFMQNVLEYTQYSPWADFYIWDGEPGNSNYEFFFDWASLPNLNHNNEDVREYFINVAKYWVTEFDIDGYRCDVAWGVEQRNDQFWKDWREALKNIKPDLFLQAEASSSEGVYYDKRFDSANDWDLRNKIIGAVNGTNSIGVMDAELRRSYPAHARPFRFVENHDEVRVASSHDTQRSKLMHTIIMTANGVPLIYSGGEVGEKTNRDLIDWSDEDGIRPYFKSLVDLRKKYLVNPELDLIDNSISADVYSYSSTSGENIVITVANFRDADKDVTLDLSSLPNDGQSTYFLTNLIDGTVSEVPAAQLNEFALSLASFEAKVFYFGTEAVVVDVDDKEQEIIADYELSQNYPNPFNPSTKIRYQIPEAGLVTLKIYDILGREVLTLVNEEMIPGKYEVEFNAAALSSGVYFYRIHSGNYTATKKLMLIK